MRIEIIKEHVTYELGQHEVTEERGKYLIAMGVAAEIDGIGDREKKEYTPRKEKQEYHNTPVRIKRKYNIKKK